MEFPGSKFSFNVASTTSRAPKSDEPELQATAAIHGKYKINEAASKLLGLKPKDYLVFINNMDAIEATLAKYKEGDEAAVAEVNEAGGVEAYAKSVVWAICKGWVVLDDAGEPLTTKEPLTNSLRKKLIKEGKVDEEGKAIAPTIPLFKGSRLSTKMKDGNKVGLILEGTDGNNAPLLRKGHDDDKHVVYKINSEAIPYQFENGPDVVNVDLYLLEYKGEEEKIERNS